MSIADRYFIIFLINKKQKLYRTIIVNDPAS